LRCVFLPSHNRTHSPSHSRAHTHALSLRQRPPLPWTPSLMPPSLCRHLQHGRMRHQRTSPWVVRQARWERRVFVYRLPSICASQEVRLRFVLVGVCARWRVCLLCVGASAGMLLWAHLSQPLFSPIYSSLTFSLSFPVHSQALCQAWWEWPGRQPLCPMHTSRLQLTRTEAWIVRQTWRGEHVHARRVHYQRRCPRVVSEAWRVWVVFSPWLRHGARLVTHASTNPGFCQAAAGGVAFLPKLQHGARFFKPKLKKIEFLFNRMPLDPSRPPSPVAINTLLAASYRTCRCTKSSQKLVFQARRQRQMPTP
jgi:hypothetical protein